MILRFRTKDGLFRINSELNDTIGIALNELLTKLPSLDISSIRLSDSPNGSSNSQLASEIADRSIQDLNLKNGSMIYVEYNESLQQESKGDSLKSAKTSTNEESVLLNQSSSVKMNTTIRRQLPIDDLLDKEEGLIKRPKSNFCRHTEKGMCEYCSPLPPWDRGYQNENNIKHISFHSYLKELNSLTNKKENNSSFIAPLEEQDFKIDKTCNLGHEPWPKGICSKCQPSAITLKQQEFRMVDHVEFSNSEIINEFINSWRLSGCQRIGIMFGKYDKYDKVPLGIKAKVETIYELPQIDQEDGIILQSWDNEDKILNLINQLNLLPIGIIFTDLTDANKNDGSVICKRHKDSFFLSSLEILFSVKWQLKFPNITKWSKSNFFSSKFVTCVVTGNTSNEIDINSYQISQAGESLVKADLITPSTHPSEMFINETTNERYVPEIFYQMINEYNLVVKKSAKPCFPVEYLIVSLTHGFPQNSEPFFKSIDKFPFENRAYIGESADMSQLNNYLKDSIFDANKLKFKLSNFHFLNYIFFELEILGNDDKLLIIEILKKLSINDESATVDTYKLMESPGWQTLTTILSTGF